MEVRKLWFTTDRIYIETADGTTLWQLLCYYPRLMYASAEERADCELWEDGIRWDAIDEDISYESFSYEENRQEPTALQKAFLLNPELNVSAVARKMGIRQSLLASYIKGTKRPSAERLAMIEESLHDIGRSLSAVRL